MSCIYQKLCGNCEAMTPNKNDLFATIVKFLPILSLKKRSNSRIRKPQMGGQAIKIKPPCSDF